MHEQTASSFMPSDATPLRELLHCIPFELQDYFGLPPAGVCWVCIGRDTTFLLVSRDVKTSPCLVCFAVSGLPGAWRQWTFGFGTSGSGAPFHLHEQAINLVIQGTKRCVCVHCKETHAGDRGMMCLTPMLLPQRWWFLYPPNAGEYKTEPVFEWLRDEYPNLPPERRPLELIQRSGDLVFLPAWFVTFGRGGPRCCLPFVLRTWLSFLLRSMQVGTLNCFGRRLYFDIASYCRSVGVKNKLQSGWSVFDTRCYRDCLVFKSERI